MSNEFLKALADFEQAKALLDRIVIKRAKELYPEYDNYSYDSDFDGCFAGMTQKECRKNALRSLEEGKTTAEVLAERSQNRQIGRLIRLPRDFSAILRTLSFWSHGKAQNDFIIEAVACYLDLVTETNMEKSFSREISSKTVLFPVMVDAALTERCLETGIERDVIVVECLRRYLVLIKDTELGQRLKWVRTGVL